MRKLFVNAICGMMMAIGLTSCYSASVLVGDAQENEPMTKVYTKHNTHLVSGLVNVGSDLQAQQVVGEYSGYKVNHQLSFVDQLLSSITFGLYTPSTTKIYVPTRLLNNNPYGSSKGKGFTTTNSNDVVRMTHIVKKGETLQAIANAYQVTVKDIVQWNQLSSIDVSEGTPLIIFMK